VRQIECSKNKCAYVRMHLSVQMVVLSAALRESLFLYISYIYIYRSRLRPHTRVISCPSMPSCVCTDCLVRHLPNDVWVFYYDHWFPDVWWWDKWWGRWQWWPDRRDGLHIECYEDQSIAGLTIAVVEYFEHEDELIRLCWGLNKPLLVQIAK
jgi:hypothetical protein